MTTGFRSRDGIRRRMRLARNPSAGRSMRSASSRAKGFQGVGVVRAQDAFAGGQVLLVQDDRLAGAASAWISDRRTPAADSTDSRSITDPHAPPAPGSVFTCRRHLAVCLVTPEHVPDEGNRSQRSTGSDAHGYRPLNMMGKGRRTRAGSRASPRVGPCPAPAGKTIRHLQKERADDRERHHSAQDVLGYVPRWSAGLAQAADRNQILGQLPELPTLPASRSAS